MVSKGLMQKGALSAGRTLCSTLETRVTSGSTRRSGLSNLSASRTTNGDSAQLSSRLSQRLKLAENSSTLYASGTRHTTTRIKKARTKKKDDEKAIQTLAELTSSSGSLSSSTTAKTQWTAVSAALNSLEDSISRTNLLLHSLASGEAWARRTRSSRPRISWDEKAALDSGNNQNQSNSTPSKEALAALLHELSRRQTAAANLLSRLNKSTNQALPAASSSEKTFEAVLSHQNTGAGLGEVRAKSKHMFECGWGPDALAPLPRSSSEPSIDLTTRRTASTDSDTHLTEYQTEVVQGTIEPDGLSLKSLVRDPKNIVPIPTLQHDLDRVLFNPGVHWLQDPHSKVYNFPPELQAMPAFTSFAYDRINTFVTSSKDPELADLARSEGKKFTGSTSSVSMILAHIYFLISGWRDVDVSTLSTSFVDMSREFSAGQKMPFTFFMRQNNGIVAFDSGSSSEDPLDQNILSYIGIMLEKLLTLPKDDFDMLLRSKPPTLDARTVLPEREAYRYSMANSMVLRSQLDCVDARLPGTGVFDLKTRAAISVRQDVWNVEVGSGYQIRSATGLFESFEREYYDLCRSAMLKYSFQARIGAMDGVFVAYHNTSKMFGFQYIPLEEMDQRLFGSSEGGARSFRASLGFLEIVAEGDVKAMVYTSEGTDPTLSVWVEPAVWNESTPAPMYELRLNVQHTINGEPVPPGARVTFEKPDWKISYNLTRLAPNAENRYRYDQVFIRQQAIRMSTLPEGTTIEEFLNRMKDGVLEGYSPRSGGLNVTAEDEPEGDGVSSTTLDAWNKRFRTHASPFVRSLRGLSKKGLVDLDRWAKEDAPKVVYKARA